MATFDVDKSTTAEFQALRLSSCAAVLRAYRERTQLVLRIMWVKNGTPALAGRILRYLDLTRDGAAQAIWRKARWSRVAYTRRAYAYEAFLGWSQTTMVQGQKARYISMTGTCSRLPVVYQIGDALDTQPPPGRVEKSVGRPHCKTPVLQENGP